MRLNDPGRIVHGVGSAARRRVSRATVSMLLTALVAWGANPALAAPAAPANDSVRNAIVIGSLPYSSDPIDVANASSGGEPQPGCAQLSHTVWWAVTPNSTGTVTADTILSDFGIDTVLAVYTRAGNKFTQVACGNDITGGNHRSQASFSATAGTTYYLQVGLCCSAQPKDATAPGRVTLKLAQS
jgi:hypothetical protein